MAHIVVNAVSLKPGGGIQVISALLARFSNHHRYTVLWNETHSKENIEAIVGQRKNVTFFRALNTASNMKTFLWSLIKLRGLLIELEADLLMSVNHHFPSGSVPQIVYDLNVLRFRRPKKALKSVAELADRLRDWRAKIALQKADANIFESQYLKQISGYVASARNAKVIYIGVNEQLFLNEISGSSSSNSTILALTSAQPHKDNPRLIMMLAHLRTSAPEHDWKMQIAGGRTPEVFADLHHLAESKGVSEHIEWLGFQSHQQLAEVARNALCLVSTSQVESFSMVALEAMTWGCPPIVADTTSMPESVGDAGLISKAGDHVSFAENVLRVNTLGSYTKHSSNAGFFMHKKQVGGQQRNRLKPNCLES